MFRKRTEKCTYIRIRVYIVNVANRAQIFSNFLLVGVVVCSVISPCDPEERSWFEALCEKTNSLTNC